MISKIVDVEALDRQFQAIDDICWDCRETTLSACVYVSGHCPLTMVATVRLEDARGALTCLLSDNGIQN